MCIIMPTTIIRFFFFKYEPGTGRKKNARLDNMYRNNQQRENRQARKQTDIFKRHAAGRKITDRQQMSRSAYGRDIYNIRSMAATITQGIMTSLKTSK